MMRNVIKNHMKEKSRQKTEFGDRRVGNQSHHSVFSHFAPFTGVVPKDFVVGYTGARFRNIFVDAEPSHSPSTPITAMTPGFDEEYFEWIALLTAVNAARSPFTMIELGSGFGRWLLNGAVGARHKNKSFHLVGVEAEPTHFAYMKQAFADNDIPIEEHRLIQAAVGKTEGVGWFTFGNADTWYGQSLVDETFVHSVRERQSTGNIIAPEDMEYQFTEVPIITLQSILKDLSHVHLLDMDVQGAEADVVEASTSELNEKVDVVFIGTHHVDVEVRIRRAFFAMGWLNAFDFSCFSGINSTPYGLMDFPDDGVQCWVNPRCSEFVSQLQDGRQDEWAVCRHDNTTRNLGAVYERMKCTENQLKRAEYQLKVIEYQLKSSEDHHSISEANRLQVTAQLESLQEMYRGVGPRGAILIRRAKKIKDLLWRVWPKRSA